MLRQRGLEHEAALLHGFREAGLTVAKIPANDAHSGTAAAWARMTLDAMRSGVDMIYQGCLFDGRWMGLPDFLRRIDVRAIWGSGPTKSLTRSWPAKRRWGRCYRSRTTRACFQRLRAWSRSTCTWRWAVGDGGGGALLLSRLRGLHPFGAEPPPSCTRGWTGVHSPTPKPVEHCEVCAWKPVCQERWREDDHLSLVAGITSKQRRQLEERGVSTLAALGGITLPLRPQIEGVSETSLEKVREQVRIQLEGRGAGEYRYETLYGSTGRVRPKPSPGAQPRRTSSSTSRADPYALGEGLEYLFGYCDRDLAFTGHWALSRAEERSVFERFMDIVSSRLERWPELHVYHYGHYEVVALKWLAGRYGTREAELDRFTARRGTCGPVPHCDAVAPRIGRELFDQEAGAALPLPAGGGVAGPQIQPSRTSRLGWRWARASVKRATSWTRSMGTTATTVSPPRS